MPPTGNGGLHDQNHPEYIEDYYIPCWNGSTFDANVGRFTDPSVGVIFIGGDSTFSTATAAAIEQAVHDNGKVLFLNFWSNQNFHSCLPAYNQGGHDYGDHLTVTDSNNPIFSGLASFYPRTGADCNREACTEKPGATVLMRYDNGDPALLYWQYGKGYVAEWTMEMMGAFGGDGLVYDTIDHRLLNQLTGVPEPSRALLLGVGTASLLAYAWRRRRVTSTATTRCPSRKADSCG